MCSLKTHLTLFDCSTIGLIAENREGIRVFYCQLFTSYADQNVKRRLSCVTVCMFFIRYCIYFTGDKKRFQ